jgi:hypothetical protein
MCARGRGGDLSGHFRRISFVNKSNGYLFSSLAPFTNVNLRLPRFPPLTINTAVMADVAERMAILMESMEQMAQVLKQL